MPCSNKIFTILYVTVIGQGHLVVRTREGTRAHPAQHSPAATRGASHHIPVGLGVFFATAPATQAVVRVNTTKETQLWQGSSGGHAAKWPLASSACEAWTPTFT